MNFQSYLKLCPLFITSIKLCTNDFLSVWKGKKSIKIQKEETELSSFTNDMVVNLGNQQESTDKLYD